MIPLAAGSSTPLIVVGGYLLLLMGLGYVSTRGFRGTSSDYFVASRSIGPFLLLMSLFGTTMTGFALVGSTAKTFDVGIGVYGLMASTSGLVHSAVFFLIGIKLWAIGKRHGYVTQIQFFRERFQSNLLGYLLFPILVLLVIPYLLVGLLAAGSVVGGVSGGLVPSWITGLVVCAVVLFYIFLGGVRGAAWANAFQTMVFMFTGIIAFVLISNALGGLDAASDAVKSNPKYEAYLARDGLIGHGEFLTYFLIPLSVGMFPHLFQHWLTARSAKTFRLSIVAHPVFIMIVWVPCVLIGVWALGTDKVPDTMSGNKILAAMVGKLLDQPFLTGLLTAGILAAIMSSLDSQFVCLGTMFTHDIVLHTSSKDRFTDQQKVMIGRAFIVLVVAITYVLSLLEPPHVFDLGVWCFTGFASLFPIVFAAIYWRRVTAAGVIAAVLVMAMVWGILFYQDIVAPRLDAAPTAAEATLAAEPEDAESTRTPEARGKKPEFLVGGMMPVAIVFLATALTLILVSLVTTPPPKEHVDQFFFKRTE